MKNFEETPTFEKFERKRGSSEKKFQKQKASWKEQRRNHIRNQKQW